MKMLSSVLFFGLMAVMPCSSRDFERDRIKPISVRIPAFNQEMWVETNQEEFVIRVEETSNLFSIVEWCVNKYLRSKKHRGIFKFRETLYDIVNSIKTRSGNSDPAYPGETISFRLPARFKAYELEYYRPMERVCGLSELRKLLDFVWLIPYTEKEFNCSERAAFMEYYLENHGFKSDIVGNKDHTWCIVEFELGKWASIESVSSPPAIEKGSKHYEFRYADIVEAVDAAPEEFDWWNAVKEGIVIGSKK
jgi:hypothetical protein